MKTFLHGLLVSAVAALAPIKAVIITVGILILCDLITGVIAALKRKEKVSSAKLRNSVTKCLVYQTAVITGFLVQVNLLQDFIPIVNIVASLIGLTELTSLYENLNVIYGSNIFNRVIEQLGSKNLPESQKPPEPEN